MFFSMAESDQYFMETDCCAYQQMNERGKKNQEFWKHGLFSHLNKWITEFIVKKQDKTEPPPKKKPKKNKTNEKNILKSLLFKSLISFFCFHYFFQTKSFSIHEACSIYLII